MNELLPVTRFILTLETVAKEIRHLQYSWHRVFSEEINANWVKNLENTPETAERMEAFISRFGRTQDTISDKLLPRWLMALAEKTGSQIEILNRAERLGILQNTENWLQARYLRNRLVHEYMTDPAAFAKDLLLAKTYSPMFSYTYNQARQFAIDRMQIDPGELPDKAKGFY